MALNGLFCADVPLRNYSLTHSFSCRLKPEAQHFYATTYPWRCSKLTSLTTISAPLSFVPFPSSLPLFPLKAS